MRAFRFEFNSEFAAPAEAVWDFHLSPEALERLTPRLMGFRVTDPGDGVADGSLVRFEVGVWPFRFAWHALHSGVRAPRTFTDQATKSPFRYWLHQHVIEPVSATSCRLRDVIWVLPPSWAPRWAARPALRLGLRLLFAWRHRQTARAVLTEGADLKPLDSGQPLLNL